MCYQCKKTSFFVCTVLYQNDSINTLFITKKYFSSNILMIHKHLLKVKMNDVIKLHKMAGTEHNNCGCVLKTCKQ